VADRADVGVEKRQFVPVTERALERLLENGFAPELLNNHLGWDLALAKARNLHLATESAGGPVKAALDLGGIDRHVDLDPPPLELGYGRLHRPSEIRAIPPRPAR